MKKYIDVSVSVSPDLPVWPGSPEVSFIRQFDVEKGDIVTDTTISFSVHTGTHVDAPMHFVSGGCSVEELSLDILIGEAYVVSLSDSVDVITADILSKIDMPDGTNRLLIKTRNSKLWQLKNKEFKKDFVALTSDAAQWVVDHGIQLIGIDYLSVQRFYDGPETHQIILENQVIIIEGLDLSAIVEGRYELICLPIKLKDVEGAPARVLLRSISE